MLNDRWFDVDGIMSPGGENGFLFTSQFILLSDGEYCSDISSRALSKISIGLGEFGLDPLEPWSHDNHTGLVCFSKVLNLDIHRKIYLKHWYAMLHPKDFIFHMWAAGGWRAALVFPFLWILSISMILTCAQDFKIRPTFRERLKLRWFFGKKVRSERINDTLTLDYYIKNSGQEYVLRRFLKTDGKILAWMRLKAFRMPITSFFCNLAISKNKEFGTWKRCFELYFKHPSHPNRSFPDSNYEV